MNYFVYVLSSTVTKKTYVGSTNDLGRRLLEHNKGKSYFTKRYIPWKIIYTEEFDSMLAARQREKYLKSRSGRRVMVKRLFEN